MLKTHNENDLIELNMKLYDAYTANNGILERDEQQAVVDELARLEAGITQAVERIKNEREAQKQKPCMSSVLHCRTHTGTAL